MLTLFALISTLTVASPADGLLIQTGDLYGAAADENLVVLQVGTRAAFEAGHIPGAAHVALSDVAVTGGGIEGDVAIRASGSRLDLAGVKIEGREAALSAEQPSSVVFSLCRVRSPRTQGERHEALWMTADNPL